MSPANILIVEDERIVGKDIEHTLKDLGYDSLGVVDTGRKALEKVDVLQPDLVLMDVRLKGELDGIETAELIKDRFGVPVIYLTAYADEATLERAKITEPFGYILKPFYKRDLHSTIEMALYKCKIENRLKVKEEWFSTTLRSIGDAVVTTDVTGAVSFINPVGEELLGCKAEIVVGKNLRESCRLIHDGSKDVVYDPLEETLVQGKTKRLSNHSILILEDGRRIPVDNSVAPILDDRGRITGAVIVFRDVSERKHLEGQLMHFQEMKVLGQLAVGVAHEVRNPLNAILAISEALFQDIGDNKEYQPYLEHIRGQVNRLSELMKDLLELGKPVQRSHMKNESLSDLCSGLLNLWHQTTLSKLNPLSYNEPDGLGNLSVTVDGQRLQQVFLNLLENAAQHSPPGDEIILRILVPVGDMVRIRIVDKGAGIGADGLEKVFEPFYTTRRGGVGLGLSIVKHSIESMGGTIRIWNNDPGPGCSAEVSLPVIWEVRP